MSYLNLDVSKAVSFVDKKALAKQQELAMKAYDTLVSKEGAGNDFLGWLDLPFDYDKEEFVRIQKAAKRIKEQAEVLLVIKW